MMSPSKITRHSLPVLIRSAMRKLRIRSACKFAHHIGVPYNTIGPYLSGARNPKRGRQFWTVEAICMKIIGTSGIRFSKTWPYRSAGWNGGRKAKTKATP